MVYVLKLAACAMAALGLSVLAPPVEAQSTIKLWNIHPDGCSVTSP